MDVSTSDDVNGGLRQRNAPSSDARSMHSGWEDEDNLASQLTPQERLVLETENAEILHEMENDLDQVRYGHTKKFLQLLGKLNPSSQDNHPNVARNI